MWKKICQEKACKKTLLELRLREELIYSSNSKVFVIVDEKRMLSVFEKLLG